ncbi:hypothetical protein L1987_45714 [Smallanthus sonchifolius]|uniref:Uncharacterized protein n=1 Tax=Smallanthus sonchifolius TaxID=185202 RepID=A0ACB9FXU4_9ASTR|nr:hypothetical protein L1987_45714 [Smallanthus sonchifolius]
MMAGIDMAGSSKPVSVKLEKNLKPVKCLESDPADMAVMTLHWQEKEFHWFLKNYRILSKWEPEYPQAVVNAYRVLFSRDLEERVIDVKAGALPIIERYSNNFCFPELSVPMGGVGKSRGKVSLAKTETPGSGMIVLSDTPNESSSSEVMPLWRCAVSRAGTQPETGDVTVVGIQKLSAEVKGSSVEVVSARDKRGTKEVKKGSDSKDAGPGPIRSPRMKRRQMSERVELASQIFQGVTAPVKAGEETLIRRKWTPQG